MAKLFLDFETRSTVDLKKQGADNYARHESTEVMAIGYAFDDEPVEVVRYGNPLPDRLVRHIASGGLVIAHNFYFEWLIWNYVLNRSSNNYPALNISNAQCTMVMAYALGLPGSLEKAAAAAGLNHEKDMKGSRIMLQLSQPRETENDKAIWWDQMEYKDKYERMYSYCAQDVEVERALYYRLLPLSKSENEMWHLDHTINQRGIRVDIQAAKSAIEIVAFEQKRLNNLLKEVTNGAVATCSSNAQLTDWLRSLGIKCDGVSKPDVASLLETKNLDKIARSALLIRQEAAKSSTAKFESLINRTGTDGRLRSTLQYHGAGTGRWSGRGFQVHNLPRPKLKEHELNHIFHILSLDKPVENKRDWIDVYYGPTLSALSDTIRGFLIPSDCMDFISADYSNIEGRVLAWLANEEWKIDAFNKFDNKEGPDLYRLAASRIYGCTLDEVDMGRRTIGKIAELALGYQGGIGAFQTMAKTTGVKVEDKMANTIKESWRASHPKTVSFWYELERLSIKAVKDPGTVYFTEQRHIKYRKVGSFLLCQLPSGRCISYPYPQIEIIDTPWGQKKEALTYQGMTLNQWTKQNAYGGLLAENITQAVARDILAEAIKRLEAREYPVAFHVHDEIVCEIQENDKTQTLEQMTQIMCEPTKWSNGLPIVAEGWRGKRYQK